MLQICTAFYSYRKMDLMAKIVSKVPLKKCTKSTGERLNIVAVQCCLHSKYHLVSKERPLGTYRLRFLTIISKIVMFSYQNTCGFLKLFHPSSCQMETFEWHDKRATQNSVLKSIQKSPQINLKGMLGLIVLQGVDCHLTIVSMVPYYFQRTILKKTQWDM